MTYLIKYVFQTNRRFKSKLFQHDCKNKKIKNMKKHISCECKCKFGGRKNEIQIKNGITYNDDVSVKIWENIMGTKKVILEPCNKKLWKWQKFTNYYWWLSD